MNLDLQNRKALVCGGSQGLGLASAVALSKLGAELILVSRNAGRLQQALSSLSVEHGQQHRFLALDLSDTAAVHSSVQRLLQETGPIEILVNNAGGPPAGALLSTPEDALELAFRTHVLASHTLMRLLVPGMQQKGYGRIVNITSTAVKQPINGLGISNAVRAALANWAKTLANELGASGITVNNVLPGYTRTERLDYLFGKQAADAGLTPEQIREKTVASIPAQRIGEPEEFAAAVAFLCSPAASYINGVNLPVDGGRTGSL